MTAPVDAWDAATRVIAAFEAHATPYAIGGAMSYGLWAIDDAAARRGHEDGGFFVRRFGASA